LIDDVTITADHVKFTVDSGFR